MDPLYLSEEEKGTNKSMPRNTATVEMTGEGHETLAIDVWSGYLVDALIEDDQNRISSKRVFVYSALHWK